MPEDTEHESIRQFTELIRENHASLRSYIRSLGARTDWVDDIAQDVFVIAYRKRKDFESGGDFGSWVRGIARRCVANELRQQARRQRLISQTLTRQFLHEPARLEFVDADQQELIRIMSECIDKLPQRGRCLLLRRYINRHSAVRLAREFKTTADAVRHKLMRLRMAVKQCMKMRWQELNA